MIAASILFKLPLTTNWTELQEKAKFRAKSFYLTLPGLVTKSFVLNEQTGEYGGLYVWENRHFLDEFLSSETLKNSEKLFGKPEVKIFDIVTLVEHGKITA